MDKRIIKVTIGNQTYENFFIRFSGETYTNAIVNNAILEIMNLSNDKITSIVRQTSPFYQNPKRDDVIIEIGREGVGYSLLFEGKVFRSYVTNPPDKNLIIKCISSYQDNLLLLNLSFNRKEQLSVIMKSIADKLGYRLSFNIADRTIHNFTVDDSFKNVLKHVKSILKSDEQIFIRNGTLYLKKVNDKISDNIISIKTNDIIGIPIVTDTGLEVQFLFNNIVYAGDMIDIESKLNPSCNGKWIVYQLGLDFTNRLSQFNYRAYCVPFQQ